MEDLAINLGVVAGRLSKSVIGTQTLKANPSVVGGFHIANALKVAGRLYRLNVGLILVMTFLKE